MILVVLQGGLCIIRVCHAVTQCHAENQSISITTFRGGLCIFAWHCVTAWQACSISKNILININYYSILILHSVLILNPLNPPRLFSNLKSRTYLKLVIRCISFWISRNGLEIASLYREGLFCGGWRVEGWF